MSEDFWDDAIEKLVDEGGVEFSAIGMDYNDEPPEDKSIIPENEVDEKTGVRDDMGRFVKGHPGFPGAGRPPKSEEMKKLETSFYDTLKEMAEKPGEMDAVCKKLIAKAKAGSYQHQKLLFQYLLGNPEQYVNITGDKPPMVILDNKDE
jgi:hypothetical protein